MPKDTKVPTAHNGKRIATTHGLSKQDEERIEKALRDSARVIAPTPIGTARNALYTHHKDLLLTQFSAIWNFTKTTHDWTRASIGKILQNYVFDFNKKNGTGRKPGSGRKGAPGRKAGLQPDKALGKAEDDGRSSKSGPVVASPAVKRGRAHQQSATSSASSGFKSINKPTTLPAYHAMGSSSSPLRSNSTSSQSPIDSVLPSVLNIPFHEELEAAIKEATTYAALNGSRFSEQRPSTKLPEIIVAVKPSLDDHLGRKIVSFPLWRCQVPIDGRDAPPEAFQDWRDLSFLDFVRHLKAEEVVSKGDVLVWGEFDQIVRSDMTFAGAIQEQLQDAGHNGLAFNEANFAVVKGSSKSL
ncbi:hypothetical protein M438DRAFT_366781 [Aureobasidium pullulans EXF-150]|uniref:Uncharacterized protein n=1 Tax=Aureobasidium pullulans EXF-150 TaxID=1043002 RepID=A0A074XBN2_AURPU|nr:uncharacterized protein M438DRAFT_366781 [Aureobasidium pullulans EXF-150]KEQ82803.1 hypothetical protein M438DRAFT_366781 [Aureobasidium pullulans EXF-150]